MRLYSVRRKTGRESKSEELHGQEGEGNEREKGDGARQATGIKEEAGGTEGMRKGEKGKNQVTFRQP